MSPILVEGKYLYRLAVDERQSSDNEASTELKEKWVKWQRGLQNVKVPRSTALYLGDITTIVLHHMMDASSKAASAQTIGRFRFTTRTRTKTKFAANGCWDMLVLVASSFHRLDTKMKTIEAKQ